MSSRSDIKKTNKEKKRVKINIYMVIIMSLSFDCNKK